MILVTVIACLALCLWACWIGAKLAALDDADYRRRHDAAAAFLNSVRYVEGEGWQRCIDGEWHKLENDIWTET